MGRARRQRAARGVATSATRGQARWSGRSAAAAGGVRDATFSCFGAARVRGRAGPRVGESAGPGKENGLWCERLSLLSFLSPSLYIASSHSLKTFLRKPKPSLPSTGTSSISHGPPARPHHPAQATAHVPDLSQFGTPGRPRAACVCCMQAEKVFACRRVGHRSNEWRARLLPRPSRRGQ